MARDEWEQARGYVERLRQKGRTDEEIRQIMLKGGWMQEQVEKLVAREVPQAPAPPPPAPRPSPRSSATPREFLRAQRAEGRSDRETRQKLEAGAEVNARDDLGCTPLYKAAHGGHTEVAKLLVQAGANVNAGSKEGWTPLDLAAAMCADAELAGLLLEAGAEVNGRNEEGRTPLHLAAHFGHTGVVQLLLERGAEVNARDQEDMTPLQYATDSAERYRLEYPDDAAAARFTEAARARCTEVVNLLRQHGAKE